MNFSDFLLAVPKIKKLALPAQSSQFKMSPPFRKELIERYKDEMKTARRAGVMALFFPDERNKTKFVLILRKTYEGVHSAQIGLPGGKIETGDKSLQEAALRETEEEIGVPKEKIEVIKELTDLYIPPSNFYVQPFIGIFYELPTFIADVTEVEKIIEVSFEDLLDNNALTSKKVKTSYAISIDVPAFRFDDQIVWGATAMILSEIKDLLKQIL